MGLSLTMATNSRAFGELGKIIAAAGRVASGELIGKSARAFGDESHRLARETTAAGKNPMGRAWKPKRDGSGRALKGVETQLQLVVWKGGFKLHVPGKPWLVFHQRGAKSRKAGSESQHLFGRRKTGKWKLPKRSMLPRSSLPKPWRERVIARLQSEWYRTWR